MQTEFILASAGKYSHSMVDALPHMAGMLMVMMTLVVLWWVCALTAKVLATIMPATAGGAPAPMAPARPTPVAVKPEASHSVAQSSSASSSPVTSGTPPEIVAVIAAAVATVSANPVRIVSIRRIDSSWERAGRKSVLTSHRIR